MDRPIRPPKNQRKKWIIFICAALLLLLFIFSNNNASRAYVDLNTVTIRETSKQDFQELIAVDGVVLPGRTVVIDALIGGKIEEKYAADGDMLKQGDRILKLENTDLQLDILNKETAVFDLLNNIQNTRNLLDQTLVNRRDQLADITYRLVESQREYQLNEILFEKDGISKQAFIQSKNTLHYHENKKKLLEQALLQDSLSTEQQIKQMKSSVLRAKENLKLMQQKLEDLVIQSPIDGQLSSFDLEVGQLVNKGDNIGQLDVLTAYKVKIRIDERYVSRVFLGSIGNVKHENESYPLKIKHVYPTILNNEFAADMLFSGPAPENLKRGQNVVVRLELSQVEKALVLPKGGFFQSTGGNAVFVVGDDGNMAVKRAIKLGRQNPGFYEVLEGLEENEKVVTSSYDHFLEHEIIYFK